MNKTPHYDSYVKILEDELGEVVVLDDVVEAVVDVGLVDDNVLVLKLRSVERDVFEELLKQRVEAAGADVFRLLVDVASELRDAADGILLERELDADGEATLELRNEVGRLCNVECAGRDEEHMVGLHGAVLCRDLRALDNRQDVALHAFARDVGAIRIALDGDLVNLVKAPFIKVEATKFTEVGYVGRDVESIVRDLAGHRAHAPAPRIDRGHRD